MKRLRKVYFKINNWRLFIVEIYVRSWWKVRENVRISCGSGPWCQLLKETRKEVELKEVRPLLTTFPEPQVCPSHGLTMVAISLLDNSSPSQPPILSCFALAPPPGSPWCRASPTYEFIQARRELDQDVHSIKCLWLPQVGESGPRWPRQWPPKGLHLWLAQTNLRETYASKKLLSQQLFQLLSTTVLYVFVHAKSRAWSFCHVWLCVTLWAIALQAPLSMWILQERILEWVAMPSSRGSSWPKDGNCVSYISLIQINVCYLINTYSLKSVLSLCTFCIWGTKLIQVNLLQRRSQFWPHVGNHFFDLLFIAFVITIIYNSLPQRTLLSCLTEN